MDRATKELIRSGLRSTAVKEVVHVDDFTLGDAHGEPVRLQQLLEAGHVVVAFYCGRWCPYRNIGLRGFELVLPEINALGASMTAITQLPDSVLSTEEKNSLTFPVLSDIGNVQSEIGHAYLVSKESSCPQGNQPVC